MYDNIKNKKTIDSFILVIIGIIFGFIVIYIQNNFSFEILSKKHNIEKHTVSSEFAEYTS